MRRTSSVFEATQMSGSEKNILVLSRRDPVEAMRVAAGLTIFGHGVRLIFMGPALSEEVMEHENAELLELCEIEPETTNSEMAEMLNLLAPEALAIAMTECDEVINI